MNSAAVLSWALQTGLAVSVLIGLVLIVRRPFARYFGAGAAYALWSLPVIRLFMPPITIPIFERKVPDTVPNIETIFLPQTLSSSAPTEAGMAIHWPPLIVGFWLSIAALWLVYQLLRQSNYMNALHERTQPAAHLNPKILEASLTARLNKAPDVRLAPDNAGPMVTGLFKPLIVLPHNFETNYSPSQQHFALLHECTHIARKDIWAAFGALVFRALNWPNPLIHYAAHKFRTDQEAACDAAVLKRMGGTPATAHGYAATLVHAAKHANSNTVVQPLGLTIHHPLKERLMTLSNPDIKTGYMTRAVAAAVLALGLGLSAPISLATDHPGETEVETSAKSKSKKIIKWTEKDEIGNEVSKHYEIITEDGETKAWEIDAFGNKTEVDVADVKGHHKLSTFANDGGKTKMRVLRMGDSNAFKFDSGDENRLVIKKIIEESEFGSGQDMEFPKGLMTEDHEVIIKRLADGKNAKVFAFSSNGDLEITSDGNSFVFGDTDHTKSLVTAAEGMLSNAKTDDLSSGARRKLEKAQKALKEAKEALEAEKD